LGILEPFQTSPDTSIRADAEKEIEAVRDLEKEAGKHREEAEAILAMLEPPEWGKIEEARARLESLGKADLPAPVRGGLGAIGDRIEAARTRLLSTLEKDGLLFVEGGRYRVGSDDEGDKNPSHDVELKSFVISRTEVTREQYGIFLQATGRASPPGFEGLSPEHPVTHVTAEEAAEYCQWLSKAGEARYRLPTADEWEASAAWDRNGGRVRTYPWGDDFETGKANIDGGLVRKVGSGESDCSPSGAMDMAGNVSEWVIDPSGKGYLVCGGCCDDEGDEMAARCAFRQRLPAKTRGRSLGFRIVRVLE
jgi:formylglycine-generating enzyme required for sulfatase activity